jgi:hypothetical protein
MRRLGLVELPIEVGGFPLKPQRTRLEWGTGGCSAGGRSQVSEARPGATRFLVGKDSRLSLSFNGVC